MSTDANRAAFEAFAQNCPMGGYRIARDTRPGRDGYWSSHTQLLWDTWQAAVQHALAAQPVLYSPIATRSQIDGKHPNDKEARDPARNEYLRRRGDDEGQGLCDYWKWGHAAGWNDHKRHAAEAAPQQAAPAPTKRERDASADRSAFELWWAEHMPDSEQCHAWLEWCSIRANSPPKSEAAPAGQAEAPSVPPGFVIESGAGGIRDKRHRWVRVKHPDSEFSDYFYEDRNRTMFEFLSVLTARPQAPAAEAVQPEPGAAG